MAREFQQHYDRARQQLGHHDVRGAIESLRRALSIDPDDADAHALLSLCLHDERRLHAAAHEARIALALEPQSPFAHYAMAMSEQASRRFTEAEEHLRIAVAADPGNAAYHLAFARLYTLWDRIQDARTLLEKARELAPDDADCWAALAEHHYQRRRDFTQAESDARRALEIDPQNSDALLVMGHLLLRRGEVAEAREHALLVLRENALHAGGIALLTAVKARQNLLLGVWWRFNSFFAAGSATRRVLLLVGLYVVYRVGGMLAGDLGYTGARGALTIVWLAFCVYTWTGPALFQKLLERELSPATLSPRY